MTRAYDSADRSRCIDLRYGATRECVAGSVAAAPHVVELHCLGSSDSMQTLSVGQKMAHRLRKKRALRDASSDSAARTADSVHEGASMFNSRPRKYDILCIMFNNLSASSRSTLGHYCVFRAN